MRGCARSSRAAGPERRGRHQADLAGPAQHHRRLDAGEQGVEISDEPVRDTVRRPLHPRAALSCTRKDPPNRLTHRISDTPNDLLAAIQTPGTELLGLWHRRPCRVQRVRQYAPAILPTAGMNRPRYAAIWYRSLRCGPFGAPHKFRNLWHSFGEGGMPCKCNTSGTGSGEFYRPVTAHPLAIECM